MENLFKMNGSLCKRDETNSNDKIWMFNVAPDSPVPAPRLSIR